MTLAATVRGLPTTLLRGASVVAARVEVELLLRTGALDTCLRRLDRGPNTAATDVDEEADRILVATGRLLRNRSIPRTTCLQRALCRFTLLRRLGLRPSFVMGLASGAELVGHAWIELDGVPIGETEAPNYTETFRDPSRP